MSADEKLLLFLLERLKGSDEQAVVLQSFIAHNGPLSEEAGERVRTILSVPEGYKPSVETECPRDGVLIGRVEDDGLLREPAPNAWTIRQSN